MRGWLIVNGFLKNKKFDEIRQMFVDSAKEFQINLTVIENTRLLAGYSLEKEIINKDLKRPDFVIFWDKDILLARYLEQKGLRVLNSSETIRICDDKRETYLNLAKKNIKTPKTIIMPMTYDNIGLNDISFYKDIEKAIPYPIIIKEAFGSFGQQVYKANKRIEALEILDHVKTNKILFQEYISSSKGRDVRLQVVGDKVVAAMLRVSKSDFRSNITAGGNMEIYEPGSREKKLAIEAAKAVKADFAGIDILFGEEGPLVCEINSNAHFKNLYDCTGVDTSKEILKFIMKKFK